MVERAQLRHVSRVRSLDDRIDLVVGGIDAIGVDVMPEVAYAGLHKGALALLDSDTVTLESLQDTLQIGSASVAPVTSTSSR